MRNLFIGTMIIASMSNVGCSSCDKKKTEAQARACMSSPECMAMAQARLAQQAPALLKVAGPNTNPNILLGKSGQLPPPVLGPNGGAVTVQPTNADLQAKNEEIKRQLDSMNGSATPDPTAAVVPVLDPSANAGMPDQNKQVGLPDPASVR